MPERWSAEADRLEKLEEVGTIAKIDSRNTRVDYRLTDIGIYLAPPMMVPVRQLVDIDGG